MDEVAVLAEGDTGDIVADGQVTAVVGNEGDQVVVSRLPRELLHTELEVAPGEDLVASELHLQGG